jgi:hypothetical protein
MPLFVFSEPSDAQFFFARRTVFPPECPVLSPATSPCSRPSTPLHSASSRRAAPWSGSTHRATAVVDLRSPTLLHPALIAVAEVSSSSLSSLYRSLPRRSLAMAGFRLSRPRRPCPSPSRRSAIVSPVSLCATFGLLGQQPRALSPGQQESPSPSADVAAAPHLRSVPRPCASQPSRGARCARCTPSC